MKKSKCLLAAILLSLACLFAGCSNGSGSNGSAANDENNSNAAPEKTTQNPGEDPEKTNPNPTPNPNQNPPVSLRDEVSGKIGRYGKPYRVGDIVLKMVVQKNIQVSLCFLMNRSLLQLL